LGDPSKTIIPRAALDVLGLPESSAEWPEEVEDLAGREIPEGIEFHGTLRPYQFDAVCAAVAVRHGVIVAPPGAGKTVTALALAHQLKLRPLVLIHTKDLMDQWIAASEKFLGYPLDQVGAGKHTNTSPVGSVAMVQTLATWSRTQLERLARLHGVLLADECFPAGTDVDGRPIESLRIGDLVQSYDHNTGMIQSMPVKRLFKNKAPDLLVRIWLSDGRTLVMTPNHPIFSLTGYCSAAVS
jgi:hypothetical protein